MAYAAVISLKRTIQRLENSINKPRITEPASEECNSLRSMLKELDDESRRGIDRSMINELDEKIREAVWKVEDVLESYYSLIPPSRGLDEKGVEEEMNSFLKKVKILREEYYRALLQNPLPAEEEDEALSGAVQEPVNESTTVGLSDLSHKIINDLRSEINYQTFDPVTQRFVSPGEITYVGFIFSLVGMAGIGKTHLARQIYDHPNIVKHFPVRLWVTAGPKILAKDILADILAQLWHQPRDGLKKLDDFSLREHIKSDLGRRRYLIVVDDLWTPKGIDNLRLLHLPYEGNKSRFLITTRLQEVAQHWISHKTTQQMPFLNKIDSWNLLWQNVFAEESFPPQLEKPGRKIAEKCEGLPLLILAVANILRGLDKTQEYWEMVAENKTTTFPDAYENIYEVLLSSYEYLPQYLKACFLYMGVFPQSCEIPSSKLSNLWAVEDILEPWHLDLEEYAVRRVNDLVSNSLAIIIKQSFEKCRRTKSSKLHSAYWYLCVKEAGENKLFHVLNKLTNVYIERPRRLAVQNNILLGLKEVHDSMAAVTYSTTRSLLCTGVDHQYPVRICFNMMLLMRVLDALAIRFYEFPEEVVKLLQLRYLSLTHNGELPSSISNLQQLWCLILRQHHNVKFPTAPTTYLPDKIWDMQELRHLRIMGSNIPDPYKGKELPNLSTLHVNADSCTEGVFSSIPKVKKLGITIELEPDVAAETVRCLEHIKLLCGLESVKCVVVNPRLKSSQLGAAPPDHLSNLSGTLRKLSLNGLGYSWKDMTAIASLPGLKVLKLRCSAFQGPEWEVHAWQFQSLECLLLEDIDLVHWTTEDNSFRNLDHLSVRHCYKLKKIPSEMGDIKRLEMMEVDDCSPSVVASAQQIKLNKQYSDLQVVINSSWNLR